MSSNNVSVSLNSLSGCIAYIGSIGRDHDSVSCERSMTGVHYVFHMGRGQ